ncbi:MAG: ABC transporter ATP-binding protein [Candidatus Bathyarchaeia archaeon]
MEEKIILETRKLTKHYGHVHALRGVNLRVMEGEFLAIMGPSGSGKTTLLNLVGALDRTTEGEVVVRGTAINELKDLDAFRNREIGFVFQFQNLISTLTARENVEVPMHESRVGGKERKERAEKLLASVGLGERVNHKPSQLSGGERQRVAIARALVNDPAIILADEPTGELDSETGWEIVDLLRRINREEGKTIIIVTHDLEVAKRTDRVVHLRDGIVEREERVRSELLEDLVQFCNSELGRKILDMDVARDEVLERLGIFEDGGLGEKGEALRELLMELQSF